MGILKQPWSFVKKLDLPEGFSVCELGDQYITYTSPHQLAKDAYWARGCRYYLSIDGNGRGDMTADLNHPLPTTYHHAGDPPANLRTVGTFDLVTDFGTGEHIFDQAQVWRTIHSLCKVGGYIAWDRPVLGYPGHGFYLVDKTLFLDIAVANDYKVIRMADGTTKRGDLVRGVFQKRHDRAFTNPQQGRYKKLLRPILPAEVEEAAE